MKKWIVVANRISARIYSEKPFKAIATLKNPLGKERNRSLSYDKPGFSKAKFGGTSNTHSLTGEKDPHEDAALSFAKEIRDYLKEQTHQNKVDELLVVAEPKMMGRIRENLPKDILNKCKWLSKDLGHVPDTEIPRAIGLS